MTPEWTSERGGACVLEEEAREDALIEQLRAGASKAYTELVRTHGGRMLVVARRLLRCEQDALDAVQEAFLSAFKSIDSFAGTARLGTWLHRIVVNACLMKLRAQRNKRTTSIEALLPTFDETGHHARGVAPWNLPPPEQLHTSEVRSRVRACIDRLPEPYRVVLMLRDIEELDTRETAQRLGITEAATKVRLHRARMALRTLLEPIFRAEEAA